MPLDSLRRAGCFLLLLLAAATAHAGGPRWFTGQPFYTANPGSAVTFFTLTPRYFTDRGNLNANVTHAQADAMVAAAAAVWNVPTSALTLTQGGTLAEHVTSDNTYFNGTTVVFPDDVKAVNYRAIPIAVIYDTDGSVIDTLLGSGASTPSGCRQNGVVESVDGFDPAGTIDHALLILNGRCVGSSPDQLTQMQYQLMRAFGRILGVGWSQLNDNVFTGASVPTAAEIAHWPVMHPIDVLCGPYSWKCMAQPFTLRTDDLSTLANMYPVTAANLTSGKTLSSSNALALFGQITFPTGQGMDAVNVVLRLQVSFTNPDAFEMISAVSGAMHQQNAGNPVSGKPVSATASSGTPNGTQEGLYVMQRVPIIGPSGWESLYVTTEPINPLYSGDYAIAPYIGSPTGISGTPTTIYDGLEHNGAVARVDAPPQNAASTCNTGRDGYETAPVPIDPTGWWTGLLCADAHASWPTVNVKPNRTWTLEATAVDEAGIGSSAKAHLLLGVWKSSDPSGTLPTVGATPSPLNGRVIGMTQLSMAATTTAQSFRIAIADQRGHGRPDFVYKARLLYADTLAPTQLGVGGGRITLTGTGFRNGNVVTINGVPAAIISTTATQIVATAPTMLAANMTATGSADVTVNDPTTGGSTTIQAALSYGGTGIDAISLVSAPNQIETGLASSTPFAVHVFLSDGTTPATGTPVRFTASGAAATFAACNASTCTLTTDANGLIQSALTATAPGTLTLTATELSGGASVQATVTAVDPVRLITALSAPLYLAAAAPATWPVSVHVSQDAASVAGLPIIWTATNGLNLSLTTTLTDPTGTATLTASTTGLVGGTHATVTGCAWITLCATSHIFSIDPAQWVITAIGGTGQSITASSTLAPITLQVTDLTGHPLQGAPVSIYQTVDALQGVCPTAGRCPAAPVLASSKQTLTTDPTGRVTITPLELPGIPSVINIAAVTGTQGFLSLGLTKTP